MSLSSSSIELDPRHSGGKDVQINITITTPCVIINDDSDAVAASATTRVTPEGDTRVTPEGDDRVIPD